MTNPTKISFTTGPIITDIPDYQERAFVAYDAHTAPYQPDDTLNQKLWSVINREFGPNAADVVVEKLMQAVQQHVTRRAR